MTAEDAARCSEPKAMLKDLPTEEERLLREVEYLRAENARLRERLITGYAQDL